MRPARAEQDPSVSNPFLSCLGRKGFIPGYEDSVKAILNPPRDLYTIEQLGPAEFKIGSQCCIRQDVRLQNANGHVLEGSHYLPSIDRRKSWPCVVFCHGNSSSRLEAGASVQVCLPHNLSVFSFDFSGCGMSEGEYVTLGHVEQQDLLSVLQYLRRSKLVTSLALWGRSMGASTAIFIAAMERDIRAVVLDSPFTRIRTVAEELGNEAVPRFMLNLGINLLRDGVLERTGADLDALAPIESAPKAKCPAIFGASVDDTFIQPRHAKELQQAWGGKSDLFYFSGGHNAERPEWFMKEAAEWLAKQLQAVEVDTTSV